MTRTLASLLAALLTTLVPVSAFAAAPEPFHPGLDTVSIPKPDGLSSCFDHYRFGSVPAVISTSLAQVSQGSTLSFSGTLTNENTYPITDATVHIKIFHIRSHTKDVNGPDVVDFFPAKEHVTLKPSETIPLSFTWKVPADTEPGEYQAVTYVTSENRFELQGLSFTDDVVGNSTNFTIVGEKTGALRFTKDSVTVASKPFYFAAFPPRISEGVTEVPVTAEVSNTTALPMKGKITWSLYYWDALSESHLLDTKTEDLKVHPQASTTVEYLVKDTAHTVYFLKGDIVSSGGTHSLIGVRFVRSDVQEPRFNFVTIDGATAVACIHSTGNAPAKDGAVTLSVTSNVWYAPFLRVLHLGTLASASYQGDIPGDIYALTAPIKSSASGYVIHATLSQKGKTIDSFTETYSCTDLGKPCPNIIVTTLYQVFPLILVLLLIVGFLFWKRRHRTTTLPTNLPV